MASRIDLKPVQSVGTKRHVILTGILTMGASGAISSQDCDGFSVAQTGSEDGRFTITLADKYLQLRYGHAIVELPADTAATQAKALVAAVRTVDVAPAYGTDPTILLQFTIVPTAAAAGADVDVQDSSVVRILLVMNAGVV
jgi:hypothetical protein